MNNHIENAKLNLAAADDLTIISPELVSPIALRAIAEALISIAESLHELQLENEALSNHLKNGGGHDQL
jgi:hypothetical protein